MSAPESLSTSVGMDGFLPGGDGCIQLFAYASARFPHRIPRGGSVLEIGCAEANWLTPMHQARPDLTLTGIDVRSAKRPGATVLEADALTHDFPEASFDAIVFVSALEHVGLGHYGDPKDPDGDTTVMARCRKWIKPTGWLYADVPWKPDPGYEVCGTSHRIYDDATIASRLTHPGWTEVWRAWWGNDLTDTRPDPTKQPPYPGFYYLMAVWEPA